MASTFSFRINMPSKNQLIMMRLGLHPSEGSLYFLARVIVYAMHYSPGIFFSGQVCQGDLPALAIKSDDGRYLDWFEIGGPKLGKIKKALSCSDRVWIYGHRNEKRLKFLADYFKDQDRVKIFMLSQHLIKTLDRQLSFKNNWDLELNQDNLSINGYGIKLIRYN